MEVKVFLLIPSLKAEKGSEEEIYHEDDARNVVSQKSWTKDGKSVSEDWSRSHRVHAHFRKLSLGAVESLLKTLKLADSSFQQTVRDVNFERWHEIVNITFLYLHQDLGIPDKPTVSLHFYYQAAQWQCSQQHDWHAVKK